ncbi:hypothetical protein Hdeb2414_s0001g00004711 [Helianthus debilis subsp. tardiflorus]
MEALQDDTGDGSMQCTEHPFKNNTPAGGICAICLQEKLGKLVSSSFPIAVFPSSSSSSPSFRSDINNITTTTTAANNNSSNNSTTTVVNTAMPPRLLNSNTQITQITQTNTTTTTTTNCHHYQYHSNRSRILYLIGQKKKKKKDQNILITGQTSHDRNTIVYKRSKSTADGLRYMNADTTSPHNKRGFWSFIHSQKPSHSTSTSKTKTLTSISSNTMSASTRSQRDNENEITIVENNESPCHHASFDRKVSRSRSVGCGSRSFSGDFFERISTGFGDCTLRRVESHRERKSQVSVVRNNGQECIKERVRCGGLFSGFMITSSSSSSSSSSHWVVSNSNTTKETNNDNGGTGKVTSAVAGKERSWGWALASPIRAFSKPTTSKRENSNKNVTPNLGAIPSLLSLGVTKMAKMVESYYFMENGIEENKVNGG